MSLAGHRGEHDEPKRIRHISSVQIRNLTPFPARDSLVSVLAAPTSPKQLSIADDIDLTVGRRRRRVSISSAAAFNASASDDLQTPEIRPRQRTLSRGSSQSTVSTPAKPQNRGQHGTTSQASRRHVATVFKPQETEKPQEESNVSHDPTWSTWTSQNDLEDILTSRLIETFLTLSVASGNGVESNSASPLQNRSKDAENNECDKRASRVLESLTPIRRRTSSGKQSLTLAKGFSPQHGRGNEHSGLPFFISSLCKPSTNPSFDNLDSVSDFADWADLTGSRLQVTLWGNVPPGWKAGSMLRQRGINGIGQPRPVGSEWRVIEHWDVDLQDMRSLSNEATQERSRLPPNTLVIRLGSSDQYLYHPSIDWSTRPPSPDNLSDPENPPSSHTAAGSVTGSVARREREKAVIQKSLRETKMKRSLNWQDMITILSMQAAIVETAHNLTQVIDRCNSSTSKDMRTVKARQASEILDRLERLRGEKRSSKESFSRSYHDMGAKRRAIDTRFRNLDQARHLLLQTLDIQKRKEGELSDARQSSRAMESRLTSTRASLYSTLASIFPIELVSPKDLLFSVLGIPLPIPIQPTDPAPPLTSLRLPGYNEDTVAAAFAYVSQIVCLCAAYSGQTLPYPITCAGSRSNIKDSISLMMGPRKFPLYSKGVDAYRFEYAVYLINKDVEMLMVQRDLKALDMRHTLPNLKNLLLTMSSGVVMETSDRFDQVATSANREVSSTSESPVNGDGSTTPKQMQANAWVTNTFSGPWSLFRARKPPESHSKAMEDSADLSGVKPLENASSQLEDEHVGNNCEETGVKNYLPLNGDTWKTQGGSSRPPERRRPPDQTV